MDAPVITHSRRPFLAPVWLSMLAVVIAIGVAVMVYRSAKTTIVVLVRPVEKVVGTIDDPPLSNEDEQRAQRLARMFGETTPAWRLNAIYVSQTRRGQQTVAPLANLLDMRPVPVPDRDARGIATRILREHEGGTVLVMGTRANIPLLVRTLSGRADSVPGDDDSDSIFVVSIPTFGDATVLRMKF